jgi:hypothetical protein
VISANSILRVFGWTARIVLWGFCCVVALAMLYIYGRFTLAEHLQDCMDSTARAGPRIASLESAQRIVSCVDRHSGAEKVLFRRERKAVASLRNAPCRYIGIWLATRKDGTSYKVDLKKDGSFLAEPYNNARGRTKTVTGSWGVDGKNMVWLYDLGMTWPPDVNPMKDESSQGFTLIEHDGVKTRYAPFEGAQVGVCEESGR